MSSSRDNVSLYNNQEYNILSYSEENNNTNKSYSIIDADNKTKGFSEFLDFSDETSQLTQIQENFQWLKLQLLENQRIITWLDYYKIAGSFDNETDGSIIFNDMLKNSALIATQSVDYHNEIYVAGDLLYKQNNGQPQKLELGLSGIYAPILTFNDGQPILNWTWFEKGVTGKGDGNSETAQADEAYEYYKVPLVKTNIPYYGDVIDVTSVKSITINEITTNDGKPIIPVIKWYRKNTGNYEEVLWDADIIYAENSFTVSEIPSFIHYAVVK